MFRTPALLCAALVTAFSLSAQDWPNSGGNPGRNGLSDEYGPLTANLLWSGSRPSVIAWQPVIAGRRVFVVRQSGFTSSEPNASPVICHDLDTGQELWRVDIPFNAGDWTTAVLGVSDGKVYASRAGNGASVAARVYALDQATGNVVWISQDDIDAGFYDGVVFAPNGDLVIGSFRDIWRIRAADGTTAWNASRTGSVSGSCGAALFGDAVYVADSAPGGTVLKRYSLASGALQYASPVMNGFTIQQTPMVGPDGTVYLNRSQNNPTTDFFYAWDDSGTAFTQRWSVPAQWVTTGEFGVGPDGSVYMLQPGEILTRLDPATGTVLNTYPTALGDNSPRFAIDADGRLFVSNGGFSSGTLYSFDPDLTLRWSVPVRNINIGGPCLGPDGTLVVAGVGSDLRAYRSPSPWTRLGGGVAGGAGLPELDGRGSLTANNTVTLSLTGAAPSAPTILTVGASTLNAAFFGGTLVPQPDITVPVSTDANGATTLAFAWPATIAGGTNFWLQQWVLDPSAPRTVSGTDALQATSR
jgi:hypothetical protein